MGVYLLLHSIGCATPAAGIHGGKLTLLCPCVVNSVTSIGWLLGQPFGFSLVVHSCRFVACSSFFDQGVSKCLRCEGFAVLPGRADFFRSDPRTSNRSIRRP